MVVSRTRCFVLLLLLPVAGCSLADFYFEQTEGIGPVKLVPLYFQEKQYVQDRTVEARVKGAFAAEPALRGAGIGVEVYDGAVTLTGKASAMQVRQAVETAQAVFGVTSVTANLR